jgi:hypothetical protein
MNIATCHACPFVQPPPYNRTCVCTLDGRDILEHARDQYCPEGRFAWSGAGDAVAFVVHRLRLDGLSRVWERFTHRPCGCAARQKRLNGRFAGLWEWLMEWKDAFRWG